MNKKDYKEIAKITKPYLYFLSVPIKNNYCNELADYFEREDKESKEWLPNDAFDNPDLQSFDRKLFLKDCGVN